MSEECSVVEIRYEDRLVPGCGNAVQRKIKLSQVEGRPEIKREPIIDNFFCVEGQKDVLYFPKVISKMDKVSGCEGCPFYRER